MSWYYDNYKRNYVNEAILREKAFTAEQRETAAQKARERGDYRAAGELESQARRMKSGLKPYADNE